MSDPLGLSIGTTNLVAARVGNPPITRRSVLGRPRQMLSGFVERVGDPVPLVAADGSSHQADELMVEALDGMIMAAGGDQTADLSVAVPAHWNGATLRALREAMRARPRLSPNGTPARLVSDAVASLTALAANPGLPRQGVVALMDFGGGGTSITLADATSGYEPIETVRLTDFSGDQIDQALLAHVLEGIADSDEVDKEGTTAVGSLAALRDECKRAKETLSEQTATDVAFDLPGHRSAVAVSRSDLEVLIAQPLSLALAELDDLLQRNRIAWADVSTVATVGGGARIPLINVELSKHTRSPIVTTPHPAFDAAVGAAIFAAYGADADAQTGVAPAPLIDSAPDVTAPQAAGSSAFRALAWSQDDDTGSLVPYQGEDYDTTSVRAPAQYVAPTGPVDVDQPRAWHRLPQLALGVAAVVALVAVGGVAIALTSVDEKTPAPTQTPTTTLAPPPPPTTTAPPPPVVPPPPPSVVTVTSVAPPPPPPPPPPETKYVEVPAKTTTTTTTQPTTTTTTPTPTTTETTTTTTETSTTPAMTTSYITVPFVPVPIPIQVPNSGQPSQQQYPQQYPQQQYPQQYPGYQQPQYGY
jgi:Hsp70 protein